MSRHWPWIRAFFIFLGGLLGAVPPLTTIDDTLFKADGSRFTGTLLVEWKSFQAVDTSTIPTQSLRVPVVNGVLHVQLVPTTNALPGTYYSVRLLSADGLDSIERWYVPPSLTPLHLSDVRNISTSSQTGQNSPPPSSSVTVLISDVTGLQAELNSRPQKGAGFAVSRTAVINSSGQIEAVIGNLSDCVRVDGSASPCLTGLPSMPSFIDGETPAGLLNGTNAVFTLANSPIPAVSLLLYRNGMLQKASVDYTLSGNTVTFGNGSLPQSGDVLVASYRMGTIFGAGSGDSASLPAASISNINIAPAAGIQESKLGLNYPTHSNANDPTSAQKAALNGTSGAPSATNKYVTQQDLRLSDSRIPRAHSLLSASHSDTTAAVPVRGDILVAQGTSPTAWSRLPLGPANRCLMSNGADAVWNTCLFTGFPTGAVPFIDQSGNLAQNSGYFTWDASNRHLSIGTNESSATLLLNDSVAATGTTQLIVRAGQGQNGVPLQNWQDASGHDVAIIDSTGAWQAASVRSGNSASASYQDRGRAIDPTLLHNGDAWFNSAGQTEKYVAAGQIYAGPQVICSTTGLNTSATSFQRLGTCSIPAALLQSGDRFEVRFDFAHTGTSSGVEVDIRWASMPIHSRSLSSSEARLAGRAEVSIAPNLAYWSSESWGSAVAHTDQAGSFSFAALPVSLEFSGRLASAVGDQIRLGHFTVLRYPAQVNP